jgi:hypothetical protein
MKQIAFVTILMFASSAWGQAEKPAAKEEPAKPAVQAEKAKQAAATTTAGAPRIPSPRRWKEDARHCLDKPTNTEIIKCAEEFL